jgi:hypothetical protein
VFFLENFSEKQKTNMNLVSAASQLKMWKFEMKKKQEQAQRTWLKSFDYLMIFQEVSSSPFTVSN